MNAPILVAADFGGSGRSAVSTAAALARRTGAPLGLVRVRHPAERGGGEEAATVTGAFRQELGGVPAEVHFRTGLPGIEVPRLAEELGARLVVVGRTPRSQAARELVGDTADAVARRSSVPCLLVPAGARVPTRLLVAADPGRAGQLMVRTASDLAAWLGLEADVMTVEPPLGGEQELAGALPLARTAALAETVALLGSSVPGGLEVRRGSTVPVVLEALEAHGADVLALGWRRGGPPAVLEAGSVSRRLAHVSPCAVLTIPR